MKTKHRLYLTSDRKRVVKQGDPEAAYLFAVKGANVPDAEAKRFGLLEEPKKTESKPQEEEAEAKAVNSPPENKAQEGPSETRTRRASKE